MTVQQFIAALNTLTPGAQWSVSSTEGQVNLDTLTWLDQHQSRPTDQQIIDAAGL